MLCAACRLARQQRAVVGAGARRGLSQWAAAPPSAQARPAAFLAAASVALPLTRTQTQPLAQPPLPPRRTRARFFSSAAASPTASDTPTTPTSSPAAAAADGPPKPDFLDDAESVVWDRLTAAFAPVTALSVRDISGGCGSMYGIEICAEAFRGRGMLQQQRMVNGALGDLMKGWHGVQLKTRAPE